MSVSAADVGAGALTGPRSTRAVRALRDYFLSDSRRAIKTLLGVVWLVDGALQFQSFMYSRGFIGMLTQMMPGQPSWLGSSMRWASHIAAGNLDLYNTLFAVAQVLIGLGLLYRRSVKPALAVSFVWALFVWWFGEAFGMLFMNMANPLTGAPGAVLLYGIVGLIVWPNGRPGGLLGVRGARTVWAVLWVLMGGLWLLGVNSTANATTTLINAAPSGMSWLTTVQDWAANAARGNGLIIALVFAFASFAIGVAVARNWHARGFLVAAIVLNLAYWVLGQGFGGIFNGGATDPNAGPVFVLLACALYALVPIDDPVPEARRSTPQPRAETSVHAGAAV